MLRLNIKNYGLILGLLLASVPSSANHLLGADMQWECLGNDSFKVTVMTYRDCNGINLGSIRLTARCTKTSNTITSQIQSPGQGVDITPVCDSSCTRCSNSNCTFQYGIEKYTMTYILDLSSAPKSCCKVDLSWSQCCRSSSISTGLANTNFYTEATLNRCVKPCDNSPQFANPPVGILCVKDNLSYNQLVINKDKDSTGQLYDSLDFSFTPPLNGKNSPGTYNGKYSYKKPISYMGFPRSFNTMPRGIHLNSLSGNLQFKPMKAEQTVMAISVKEYRNGKFIGEVSREFYFIVVNCPNNKAPGLSGYNGGTKYRTSVCAGDSVKFTIKSNESNLKDTVRLSFNPVDLPGKPQWKDNNGKVRLPTGTFKWKTKPSYFRNTPYMFTVTARDDVCPLNARKTRNYWIKVDPVIKASINTSRLSCGRARLEAKTISGSGVNYTWIINGNEVSDKQVDKIQLLQPGTYNVKVKATAGACEEVYYDTLKIPPFLNVDLGEDTIVCKGSSITLRPNVHNASGSVSYLWSDSSTQKNLVLKNLRKDTQVILTVQDSACQATDTVRVKISRTRVQLTDPSPACSGDSIVLDPYVKQQFGENVNKPWIYIKGGENDANFKWSPEGDTTALDSTKRFSVTQSGKYILEVEDSLGCRVQDTIETLFFPEIQKAEVIPGKICPGEETWLQARVDLKDSGSVRWKDEKSSRQYFSKNVKVYPESPRTYLLTAYAWLNSKYCNDTARVHLKVKSTPKIQIKTIPPVCEDTGNIDLSGFAKPAGGKWEGGPKGSILFNRYFDPGVAGVGNYKLKYTAQDTGTGCKDSATAKIEVLPVSEVNAGKDSAMCSNAGEMVLAGTPTGGTWSGKGVAFEDSLWKFRPSIAESGLHDLVYCYRSSATGCENCDTLTMEVLAKPTVDAGTGRSVCGNDSPVTLKGTPAGGLWKGPGVTPGSIFDPGMVSPDTSYKLYYHVSSKNGCKGIDSMKMKVMVTPEARFTVSPQYGPFPLVVFFTDKSKGKINRWKWDFGVQPPQTSTLQQPSYTYSKPGKYDVELIVQQANGCRDTLVKRELISVWDPNSIEETGKDLQPFIHPNPAKEYVEVHFPEGIAYPLQVSVIPVNGKLIREYANVQKKKLHIDLKKVAKGPCLILIQDAEGNNYSGKFFK